MNPIPREAYDLEGDVFPPPGREYPEDEPPQAARRTAREVAEDLTYGWAERFPGPLFTSGAGGTRVSVTPQEAVDLAEAAYQCGLDAGARNAS